MCSFINFYAPFSMMNYYANMRAYIIWLATICHHTKHGFIVLALRIRGRFFINKYGRALLTILNLFNAHDHLAYYFHVRLRRKRKAPSSARFTQSCKCASWLQQYAYACWLINRQKSLFLSLCQYHAHDMTTLGSNVDSSDDDLHMHLTALLLFIDGQEAVV